MTDRHQRVESLLRELAAEFILGEANTNPLITVTQVTISPNYRNATVFFTTVPEDREQDALVFMQRCGGLLRQFVKKKSNLKFIPDFKFSIDSGERARQQIDEIANKISNQATKKQKDLEPRARGLFIVLKPTNHTLWAREESRSLHDQYRLSLFYFATLIKYQSTSSSPHESATGTFFPYPMKN